MSNLLVVDWDYFFPNPMEGGEYRTREVWLYDWQHSESDYYINMAWETRAVGFVRNDLPLPRCKGYEGFWDRFDLEPGTTLLTADSNLWAGRIKPGLFGGRSGARFDSVWLYDAHHDSGYGISLDDWHNQSKFSCEDWMLVHHDLGSELHVKYPEWKIHAMTAELPPAIDIERTFDNGESPGVTFDHVFVCRSGAWVPSWCDDQFAEFVASFPGDDLQLDADSVEMTRTLNRAQVDAEVTAIRLLMQTF